MSVESISARVAMPSYFQTCPHQQSPFGQWIAITGLKAHLAKQNVPPTEEIKLHASLTKQENVKKNWRWKLNCVCVEGLFTIDKCQVKEENRNRKES